jgi:uncharacterized membrane protein
VNPVVRIPLKHNDASLRLGLLATSLLFFGLAFNLWLSGRPLQYPVSLLLSFAASGAGMLCAVLAVLRNIPPRSIWLVLIGAISVLLVNFYLNRVNFSTQTAGYTDNEMIGQYAVEALKKGINPYAWNFSDMLRVFRNQSSYTPFLDGSMQYRLTYPVLPTLVLWLFDLFGLGQVKIINLVFHIILLVLMFVATPLSFRAIVLLPMFVLNTFTMYSMIGVQDIVWSTLLVGMVMVWKQPLWRAVLFGLAATFRQQPWFIAPFLMIQLWNQPGTMRERLERIAYFVSIAIAVFMLFNMPFILWDPVGWFMGAFEPAYARFSVVSEGFGALTHYGLMPFPREFYTVSQIMFLVLALLLTWRHTAFIGQAVWIFPAVFFWLYYRGLANYWVYWIPPLLIAIMQRAVQQVPMQSLSVWKTTTRMIALPTGVVGILALFYMAQPAPILATYQSPLVTDGSGNIVLQMQLEVTNNSSQEFLPRFAVQHDPNRQSLAWRIVQGPDVLQPDETATYTISTQDLPSLAFSVERGGQVIISDAKGNYWLRAVVNIPADTSRTDPDALRNPQFVYWQQNQRPSDWQLRVAQEQMVVLDKTSFEGRSALYVSVDGNSQELPAFRLTQGIPFPQTISLWVYPTIAGVNLFDEVYGIELVEADHRIWILFGNSDEWGYWGLSNQAFVYVPVMLNTWTNVHVDIQEIYSRFGWNTPTPTYRDIRGIRYLTPQTEISLIAGSALRPQTMWYFGEIQTTPLDPNVDAEFNRMINEPDAYYVMLGAMYLEQRNYAEAERAYRIALEYNPQNSEAKTGLDETILAMSDQGAVPEIGSRDRR